MVDHEPVAVPHACLDTETIAAFADGNLAPPERNRVISHIGSCDDCYHLVVAVVQSDEILSEASHNAGLRPSVRPIEDGRMRFGSRRRRVLGAGGAIALAASLLLVVVSRGTELDTLVTIVGSQRLTVARPTGGFSHGPPPATARGPGTTSSPELRAEVARLRERAVRSSEASTLHALGVGLLLTGETPASIETLQQAVQADQGDAAIRSDLGAAYMTQYLARGTAADARAALAAFDEALARSAVSPEALFNKALLLERLNRPEDAVSAWALYLAVSDQSAWRAEAIQHQNNLQQDLGRR